MKNYCMMEHGFVEATAFEGVMPKMAEKVGTVGASDVIVKMHGADAKGSDALEVIDVEKAFDSESSSEGDESDEESELSEPDFTKSDVILNSDYEPELPVIISGVSTKVNLNGNKITAPVFTESNGEVLDGNTDSYGFWVKDGSLVIEGDGEVVAQDATYSMAIWANGGNVTIKGGTFRNGGDSCDLIYASNGGVVTIEGGEFFASGPASGTVPGTKNPYSALNVKDKDYKSGISNIIVKGGIFHNFDPSNNLSEGENTNFVADGFKSVEVSENVWQVMSE